MDPSTAHHIVADPDLQMAVAEYRRVLGVLALLQVANGSRPEELVLIWRARHRAADALAARLDALLRDAGC